ncbi:ABC transporter substrate-binding protein [Euhalothece natronophila Z-M001]|uniref:ABC transporter substrate-binding protein n=1 Tax=Euhalothece natronophila Z-M001 TaxID=522448 RepID=A0A5B8NJ67_9CHRO|nr:ABC transporter substrate-binding protein [Euhalothece natronophila]QDZ38987.1 ABC transporter substrate-binding protein [Euhalothece natronophila Z-M001]
MATKKGPPPIVYILVILVLGGIAFQFFSNGDDETVTEETTTEETTTPPQEEATEEEVDQPTTEDSPLSQRFSSGERVLVDFGLDSSTALNYKQQGTEAMANSNYDQAIANFEQALQENRNDPESLIYLNNARIGNEEAYTIAVTVPIIDDTVFFSLEMLRGYAQAQNEINEAGGINGTPIKLMLVNDDDDSEVAKEVVEELAQREEVLAVTGHWSSGTTLGTIPVYDENELVLVNPVSTSTEISGASDYVFRTIPSNFFVGAAMAEYALNDLEVSNVAIFYDSDSGYSLSLNREFKSALATRGGSVVAEIDLSAGGFRPRRELERVKERDAETIVFIPAPETVSRALEIVNVNNRELPLIGDIGNLYGVRTLEVGGENAVGMVIPIPWHIEQPGSEDFVQTSRELWGADVNWATVMTYDAMSAIAQALEQSPTREGLKNALSDSDFSAEGVMQPIEFLPSGDRDGDLVMVEVQPASPSRSGTGYDFVPYEPN